MRKITAIVLLLVFLMYHLGYYGIYLTSRYQLEKSWQNKIDNGQLSSKELLIASVPISFPYRPDQSHFQPASGTVEIEGKFYRIVKQRYVKDTLYIQYVKDKALEGLHQSLQDWIASFIQKPASKKGNNQFWRSLSRDFLISSLPEISALAAGHQVTYDNYLLCFEEIAIIVPSPPPKV